VPDAIGGFHVAISSKIGPPRSQGADELHVGEAAQLIAKAVGNRVVAQRSPVCRNAAKALEYREAERNVHHVVFRRQFYFFRLTPLEHALSAPMRYSVIFQNSVGGGDIS
jgi:hypothetical protein